MGVLERVAEVRSLMVDQASDLDLGFVATTTVFRLSWSDLRPAYGQDSLLPFFRLLRDEFTPDAYGVQVLTGKHLAKTSNLDGWDVSLVAPDRYLVQARDLVPWFDRWSPQDDAASLRPPAVISVTPF
jgi:hypothetical protein